MDSVTSPIEITRHTYAVDNETREAASYRPITWVTITPFKGGLAVNGPALVDTGATMTAIDSRIAQSFGFTVSGAISVLTADGRESTSPIYEMQLSGIAGYVQDLIISSCNVFDQGIIALIGTDVLANGKLTYDGTAGEFTLEVPSTSQPGPYT